MAFPLQLIIVGPLARLIFRTIFLRHRNEAGAGEIEIRNEDEEIIEEIM